MTLDPVHLDIPYTPPIYLRTQWLGLRDLDYSARSFGQLRQVAEQLITAHALHPCALRMHAADAYELSAHQRFRPLHGLGQILGRILGMTLILDPDGVQGEMQLEICSGCQGSLPMCDYGRAEQ